MGAKDSKPSFISYEDAARRVSDSELRRIREAFKRCASGNGATLSLEAFVNEVLCGGVPQEVAEWLFAACGGTRRGIAFRDLLCGIVVLTKGSIDEKIKFLWTLYVNNQHENGMYIYKWDFARTLHLENSSLPITNAPKTAEILTGLFGAGDKVTYEQFRSWLLMHRDATVLSKWLLSDRNYSSAQDLETPTFYQSLAGVTHLEERDIIELEKCFWSLRNAAPTGQLDAASLSPLLSPPLPAAAVPGLFLAFDENRDGHVDFKELCCGLSAACRGPKTERLKFCFKIFDRDRDGVLNQQELADMVGVLCHVANEAQRDQSRASTPDSRDSPEKLFDPDVTIAHLKEKLVHAPRHHKPVFQLGPTLEDSIEVDKLTVDSDSVIEVPVDSDSEVSGAVLALEDFLIWSVESAEELLGPFLEVLVGVCHVVLGLRPQCRHQERDIVLGWLRRSLARGMAVGQFWYLVCAQWWAAWGAYTAAPDACCPAGDPPADDSFTTNSTESMGSLLYRCDSASLDSSSSGVSSAGGARAPPPIDNARLLAPSTCKVRTLTGEGGHLRRDVTLCQGRDFELLPDALWRALALWYGGGQPLPRQIRVTWSCCPTHCGARWPCGTGAGSRCRDRCDTEPCVYRDKGDLELLPDALWRALALWYGGGQPLPRQIRVTWSCCPTHCGARWPCGTWAGSRCRDRCDTEPCVYRDKGDLELLPDALWRALALWYGGGQPLPRQVIRPPNSDVELELYPLQLKILRHVQSPQTMNNSVVGVGGAALYSSVPLAPAPPQRQLAYTAAFSRLATVGQLGPARARAAAAPARLHRRLLAPRHRRTGTWGQLTHGHPAPSCTARSRSRLRRRSASSPTPPPSRASPPSDRYVGTTDTRTPRPQLYSSVPLAPAPPQRQLAYTAAFSRLATVGQVCEFLCTTLHLAREDMRLWLVSPSQSVLLDDELTTLQQLTALQEQPAGSTVLLEQRAADRAWPEETGLVR
ncbi:unnamed protein product [Plutella xylostella]|uniref:(diamondback moth) hypothetical protein n=1 Tax=Plutella xylostella TaxID=51655 RepID=A0A8S4DTS6_PLUXY|nr:unnamed protein product [Plutella xylostella]